MFDNEFPPLGGGTGVVNHHLFEELAAYPDVFVDLVTSSRTRSDYEYEQFSSRIRIHKVPVDNRNIHHATNPELLRYAFRGVREGRRLSASRHYDISFAFAGVPAGAMSLALWKTRHLPYVVSLQGPDVPGFEARYAWLYPALSPLIRVVWREARAVIAISNAHRALATAFMPDVPIHIIHNGVDLEAFDTTRGQVSGRPSRILCSGRLIERKGQHHLLEAFARLRQEAHIDAQLILAGTGDMEDALQDQARRLGIGSHVRFLGYVERERMPKVYADADLFVLPSQSEGMSMALLEAMAAGLPVIVTDTGGSEELVSDRVNGRIVQWGDIDALFTAMADCLSGAAQLQSMGAASRSRARHFSWGEITRQYLDLLERAITGPVIPEGST
jgi:glycosyltransferase involved in cell wall biosynthesis